MNKNLRLFSWHIMFDLLGFLLFSEAVEKMVWTLLVGESDALCF